MAALVSIGELIQRSLSKWMSKSSSGFTVLVDRLAQAREQVHQWRSMEPLESRVLLTTYEIHTMNGVSLASTPDDMKTRLYVFVGDHSPSNSEIWKMRVGDEWDDWDGWIVAPDYGSVAGQLPSQGPGRHFVDFLDGQSYLVDVEHVGTNISEGPDYDYRAWVDHRAEPGWTTSQDMPYGANANGAQNPIGTVSYFVADSNSTRLLQKQWFDDNDNHQDETIGKTAMLHIPGIDLDIDSDNEDEFDVPSGGITDEDTLELDSSIGKFIPVNSGDADGDGVPDYADFDAVEGTQFVPITLQLSNNLNYAGSPSITLSFDYAASASSPYGLSPDPDGVYPPPNPGSIRLWKQDAATHGLSDYITPNTSIDASALGLSSGGTVTLYVEAVRGTTNPLPIKVRATVNGQNWSGYVEDKIHVHPIALDVDIDSDNTDGYEIPDRSAVEETFEDIATDLYPGKVILASWQDSDGDGIPDYADGFDLDERFDEDNESSNAKLTPIVLELPTGVPWDKMGSVTFDYDLSDPLSITASADSPWVLPTGGSFRIWTKDGDVPRDAMPVLTGGDLLWPGTYQIEDLGLSSSNRQVTLYLEGVKPSEEVGGASIEVVLNLDEGTILKDSVGATVVAAELLGRDYDSEEWFNVGGFVASTTDPYADSIGFLEGELNATPGAYQEYKVRIHDPRSNLEDVTVGSHEIDLTSDEGVYETSPFVTIGQSQSAEEWVPTQLIIQGTLIELSYNPAWYVPWTWFEGATDVDRVIAQEVVEIVREMEDEGWTAPPPLPGQNPDDGAFGKEVHSRLTQRMQGRDRWMMDVYVHKQTNEILSVGAPPQGVPSSAYNQIDAVRLNASNALQVGDIWDTSKVDDIFDVKSSVGGKITPAQKTVLKALNGGRDIKVLRTPSRWTHANGWHVNKKVTRALKILGLVGLATTAYAVVNSSDYDDELDEVVESFEAVKGAGHFDRRPLAIEAVQRLTSYLSNFDPVDSIDLITVGLIYAAILDPAFDD